MPGEIVPGEEFYSYEDKYVTDGAQLLIPAPLDADATAEVRALAVRVFEALRCEGLARVDFFYEEGGRGFLCNEVNTMPGFTPISMYPKLWQAAGLSLPRADRPAGRPRPRAPPPPPPQHQALTPTVTDLRLPRRRPTRRSRREGGAEEGAQLVAEAAQAGGVGLPADRAQRLGLGGDAGDRRVRRARRRGAGSPRRSRPASISAPR